jgi:hypothetical protein
MKDGSVPAFYRISDGKTCKIKEMVRVVHAVHCKSGCRK